MCGFRWTHIKILYLGNIMCVPWTYTWVRYLDLTWAYALPIWCTIKCNLEWTSSLQEVYSLSASSACTIQTGHWRPSACTISGCPSSAFHCFCPKFRLLLQRQSPIAGSPVAGPLFPAGPKARGPLSDPILTSGYSSVFDLNLLRKRNTRD